MAPGDSLIPIQNPIIAKQKQTIENDGANPSKTHVNASGMVSIKRHGVLFHRELFYPTFDHFFIR